MGLRMVMAACLLTTGCSAKGQRPPEGEPRRDGGDAAIAVAPRADARPTGPVTPAGTLAPYLLAPAGDGGVGVAGGADVVVKIEWKDAPAAVRASPGRNGCGDPRDPFVAVHTLHGVADVVVWLDGIALGKAPPALGVATVAVRRCRLDPALQVAPRVDAELVVRNLDERRVDAEVAWSEDMSAAAPTTVARTALPVVGHAVTMATGKPWLLAVTSAATSDAAYVVVPPHPYVGITDETGAARLTDVPAGTYPVKAWLRPAAGEKERLIEGSITVTAGADAEVTLQIAP